MHGLPLGAGGAPRAEVYEALVNPAVTTQFWFTGSSGRLEPGVQVEWTWAMYDVSAAPTCLPLVSPATRLRFTTSPGDTPAGAAFAAQPIIQVEDGTGTVDTSFSGPVTIAIRPATGTPGAPCWAEC